MDKKYLNSRAQFQLIKGEPDDPPCPDAKLPEGWRKSSDADGETIYYKSRTGERQYNHPNNCNYDSPESVTDSLESVTDIPTPIPEVQPTGVLTTGGLKKRYSSDDISQMGERISSLESKLDKLDSDTGNLFDYYDSDIKKNKQEIQKILSLEGEFTAFMKILEEMNQDVQKLKLKTALLGGGLRNTKKRKKSKKRKMSKKRKNTKKRKKTKKRN